MYGASLKHAERLFRRRRMTPTASKTADRTILLVEDDPAIADTLTDVLESSGYQVRHSETGAEARAAMEEGEPDLIVLDLMLPDVDGLVLCSSLKASSDVPVIICSALNQSRDRVLGLKLGADDFIGKPFDVYEFEARVEAVLRRRGRLRSPGRRTDAPAPTAPGKGGAAGGATRIGHLEIDRQRRRVALGGKPLQLTPTEYRLLLALASRPDEILSREELARQVWGYEDSGSGRTIDVHIRRLRVKLGHGPVAAPSIVSQRGFGYGLLSDGAASRAA